VSSAEPRPTPDGVGGAERGQAGQSVGVAPRGDDLVRAEQLRDVDRHPAGVAGGTEDEHVLPGLELDPWRSATQDDMAGFMAAATAIGSRSSGRTMLRRASMTVCSAIAPIVVSGRTK
jgi:hypothetical protein